MCLSFFICSIITIVAFAGAIVMTNQRQCCSPAHATLTRILFYAGKFCRPVPQHRTRRRQEEPLGVCGAAEVQGHGAKAPGSARVVGRRRIGAGRSAQIQLRWEFEVFSVEGSCSLGRVEPAEEAVRRSRGGGHVGLIRSSLAE